LEKLALQQNELAVVVDENRKVEDELHEARGKNQMISEELDELRSVTRQKGLEAR
jgi:hypothetical protein